MSICPICNGMNEIHSACPQCDDQLRDGGRVSDYYGQYSPYRDFDSVALDNGVLDVAQHQCLHLTYCPSCLHQEIISIQELTSSPSS